MEKKPRLTFLFGCPLMMNGLADLELKKNYPQGCLVFVLLPLILIAALIAGFHFNVGDVSFFPEGVTSVAWLTWMLIPVFLVSRWLSKEALRDPLRALMSSAALACLSLPLAGVSWAFLVQPFTFRTNGASLSGLLLAMMLAAGIFVGFLFASLGTLFLWFFYKLRTKRILRLATWSVLIASIMLSALAIHGAVSRPNLTKPQWISTLTPIGRVVAGNHFVEEARDDVSMWAPLDGSDREYYTKVGPYILRLYYNSLSVSDDPSLLEPGRFPHRQYVSHYHETPLELFRDEERGLLFLFRDYGWYNRLDTRYGTAFRTSDFELLELSAVDFRDLLGLPWPWIVSSLAGILFAFLLLLWNPVPKALRDPKLLWIEGELDGRGQILLGGDLAPLPLPSGFDPTETGPVVVISDEVKGGLTYRESRGSVPPLVFRGGVPHLRRAITTVQIQQMALVIAILTVTSAPIATAAFMGFLWG